MLAGLMGGYLLVFAVAAVVTWAVTPGVRRVALRLGAAVEPDFRRIHQERTATLGGAAMLLGFLAAMVAASLVPQFRPVFRGSSEPLGVVAAAVLMFVIGALDDVREVSPPAKLAGQVFAAGVLSLTGVTMFYFRVPFSDFIVLSPDLAPLVTILWVALMANAINLIDGLDGLATGVVLIAGLAFFLYATRLAEVGLISDGNLGPLVAAIVVGVCLGFLPHNFHPAHIFMGDAGALLLGVLMASSTIVVGGRTPDYSGQTFFFFAPLVIPLFILGVPIVDTLFAIVRRAVRRAPLAVADKGHLHHRLMRLGHGQRRAVLILWCWTAVLSGVVLAPTYSGEGNAIVPFAVAGLALALYGVLHPGARRARAGLNGDDPDASPDAAAADRQPPGRSRPGTGDRLTPSGSPNRPAGLAVTPVATRPARRGASRTSSRTTEAAGNGAQLPGREVESARPTGQQSGVEDPDPAP